MPAVSTFLTVAAIGAGLFGASKTRKAAKEARPEPLPPPDPPIVQGAPGEAATDVTRRLIKSGRGGNILTGQLIPKNIGKKRLLG